MILVVGATGTLGRKVVRSLLASGEQVRAMTRMIANADELKELGAQPVRADLRDADSIEFAVRGVRAIVTAAHSILGRGESASELIDDLGHRSLIDAAKAAGVEHIVYTSVIDASPNHPVDFWRSKAKVERYLEESGVGYTVIRATAFMEMHAYELIGKPLIAGKRVMLFGRGKNPRNFVAADDVAKAILGALKIPALKGQILEVGGPENLTAHQVVETFERATGKKAKVTHIPIQALKVMAKAMKPAHPGIARIIRAGIIGETTDQTFDATRLRSRLPITLTTLDSWVKGRIQG